MLLKFPTIIPMFAFKATIPRHFAGYASVALETIWLHEPRDLIFSGPLMTELSNTGTLVRTTTKLHHVCPGRVGSLKLSLSELSCKRNGFFCEPLRGATLPGGYFARSETASYASRNVALLS